MFFSSNCLFTFAITQYPCVAMHIDLLALLRPASRCGQVHTQHCRSVHILGRAAVPFLSPYAFCVVKLDYTWSPPSPVLVAVTDTSTSRPFLSSTSASSGFPMSSRTFPMFTWLAATSGCERQQRRPSGIARVLWGYRYRRIHFSTHFSFHPALFPRVYL
jgi:hypothetical protein